MMGRRPILKPLLNPLFSLYPLLSNRVLQRIEETSGHARTFARKFCVSGRFLDLSRRPDISPFRLAKVPAATGSLA
jgi:hypothetical protein